MGRSKKTFLATLLLALLFTAAFRFIQHTDREYSEWIRIHEKSAQQLDEHCAGVKTAGVCASAQQRNVFLADLRRYRGTILAWWWPTLAAMLCAWAAAVASLIALARPFLARRRADADQKIENRR